MMRKFISDFVLRGLISGGFGPLAYGIIILVLQLSGVAAVNVLLIELLRVIFNLIPELALVL